MEAYGIVAVLSFCHFFFFFLLSSKLSRLTRAETLATQAIRYAVFHWLTYPVKEDRLQYYGTVYCALLLRECTSVFLLDFRVMVNNYTISDRYSMMKLVGHPFRSLC